MGFHIGTSYHVDKQLVMFAFLKAHRRRDEPVVRILLGIDHEPYISFGVHPRCTVLVCVIKCKEAEAVIIERMRERRPHTQPLAKQQCLAGGRLARANPVACHDIIGIIIHRRNSGIGKARGIQTIGNHNSARIAGNGIA